MRRFSLRKKVQLCFIALCAVILISIPLLDIKLAPFARCRFWFSHVTDDVIVKHPYGLGPGEENAELLRAYHTLESAPSCELIREANSTQVNTSTTTQGYTMYSAVYDDRVGYLPLLRILVYHPGSVLQDKPVFCHVWYEHIQRPQVLEAIVVELGNINQEPKQSMYSCLLKVSFPYPQFASLSTGTTCQGEDRLPVHVPIRTAWRVDVGVCVPQVQTDFDHIRLLEWTELLQLLGVGHVTVYIDELMHQTKKVVEHYEEGGLFTVRRVPRSGSSTHWTGFLSNDCLLRNMHRYTHTIFLSFDDIIVPRESDSLQEALARGLQPRAVSALFNVNFFFMDFDATSVSLLTTAVFKNMVAYYQTPKENLETRLVVAAEGCLWLENGRCQIAGGNEQIVRTVNSDIAVVYRYCYCHLGIERCSELMKKSVQDVSLSRFEKVLTLRIGDRLAMLHSDLEWDVY